MIVRVFEPGLEDVVVHVLRRLTDRDGVATHLLELEPGEGPRRVLEEGLIHPEGDLLARVHFARDEVVSNQFSSERFSHGSPFGARENLLTYQCSVRTNPRRGTAMQP